MSNYKPTEDQQKVIDAKVSDILVSAAAGSGKTATLVQRIEKEVTGESKITDVDRILVVTFTKNAASQMKDKLYRRFSELLEERPNDTNLLSQMNRLSYANITTIDSFCQTIVKGNFERIEGLDPSFRIGDETELALLWQEAIEEVFEEFHTSYGTAYQDLLRSYSNRNDETVMAMVKKIYKYADSAPWPEQFIREFGEKLDFGEHFDENPIIQRVMEISEKQLQYVGNEYKRIMDATADSELKKFYDHAEALYDALAPALNSKTFESRQKVMQEYPPKLTTPTVSGKLKENPNACLAKEIRERVKKVVDGIRNDFFSKNETQIREELAVIQPVMKCLIDLTLAVSRKYHEVLQKNNVYGFSDIEHFALQILRTEDGEFTEVARRYAEEFDEIMIDEYQDSNDVQEWILQGVSHASVGGNNIFVVGDVKQSIYKFRMAKPELFIQKYNSYDTEEGSSKRKIMLSRNFRSHPPIVDFVNRVFEKIMISDVGHVEYDEPAKLVHGRVDEPVGDASRYKVEYHLVEGTGAALKDASVSAICERIKDLVDSDQQKDARTYRYSDIVILVRGMNDFARKLLAELQNHEIPSYAPAMDGYFNTPEISTVMNLLRILDNPLQDVPFASVLHSMLFQWSEEELAKLRVYLMKMVLREAQEKADELAGKSVAKAYRQANAKDYYLYEMVCELAKDMQADPVLHGKSKHFLEIFEELLDQKSKLKTGDFLEYIYQLTGFYRFCSVSKDGEIRIANLDALVQQARMFENGTFHGLSDFVNYIDKKIKYEVKIEDTASENTQDAVRIMTIHKSKGLEFPVVILPQLYKKFNMRDASGDVLLSEQYGIGPKVVRLDRRTKANSLFHSVIGRVIKEETLGEELRILYTALTRPQDKLILFGRLNGAAGSGESDDSTQTNSEVEEVTKERSEEGAKDSDLSQNAYPLPLVPSAELVHEPLSYSKVTACGCYQDWIDSAIVASVGEDEVLNSELEFCVHRTDSVMEETTDESKEDSLDLLEIGTTETLTARNRQSLSEQLEMVTLCPEKEALLEKYEAFSYPYAAEEEVPVKFSVSELKLAAMDSENATETSTVTFSSEQAAKARRIPEFLRKENLASEKETDAEKVKQASGTDVLATERGTIIHRVMELHDFTKIMSLEEVTEEMNEQVRRNLLDERAIRIISPEKAKKFYDSEIGLRMHKAASCGRLYKEQPFVMSLQAREINSSKYVTDAPVLIQGIIDVFFEEEDGLVVLDYKTDQVQKVIGEDYLKEHYQEQLRLYATAMERATGKTVKEQIIYSFALKKSISL